MPGLRMREAREPSEITIPIIVQDPRRTPNPVNVTVRGPLLAGPIGERMAVFDYNVDRDVVFPPATPRKDGSFPEYELDDMRFIAQHLRHRSPCDRTGGARTGTASALGIRRQPPARGPRQAFWKTPSTARRATASSSTRSWATARRRRTSSHSARARHRGSRNRGCHPRRRSPSLLRAVRTGNLGAARGRR